MTTEESEPISFKNFSNSVLPWILLGGALVVYLFTLNHFVTFSSLPFLSKVNGWDWQKPVAAPLYFLLTLPIKWLPTSWHAIALNFFSTLCATLSLGLLARSVALLPQDRTKEQRMREHNEFSLLSIRWAWIPVVAAVLLCGFQLTFWEHATVASGEALDLLLFAYVIRCLLEFRLTEKESWLTKFAFVYGLGIANNWAMLGYFPLFLVSLVWIRGVGFFNTRFILRLVAFGLAGMLLYLLLPTVGALSNSGLTFWESLKVHLNFQRNVVLQNPFIGFLRFDLITMAFTSLIPILLVGARWTSDHADVSPTGTLLTALMFRLLHLALLVFCVWGFFDYKFSPRAVGHGIFPFLTLYYLSALSTGYLCGYVLLVFGREGDRAWGKSRSSLRGFNKGVAFIVAVSILGLSGWLLYRNSRTIVQLNGPTVKNFARRMAQNLPKNAVVLSDDSTRLHLMEAYQDVEEKGGERIFLNTRDLTIPRYHEYLRKRFVSGQGAFVSRASYDTTLDSLTLIEVMERLRATRPLYYLQSSFGYYFERYYPRQHGLVFELKPFHGDDFRVPKLEESEIEENENFWRDVSAASLKALADLAENTPDPNLLCTFYSSALNTWGVQLQRNSQIKPANEKFYVAWQMDPNNVIAKLNYLYNERLQSGRTEPLEADEELTKQLSYSGGLLGSVARFGPIDEPSGCLALGEIFKRGGNLRQATQQAARALDFIPDALASRFQLAALLLDLHQPERALKELADARFEQKDGQYELPFINMKARALMMKQEYTAAENLMMETLQQDLKDQNRFRMVFQFFASGAGEMKGSKPELSAEWYKKALGMLDELIAGQSNSEYLFTKANLLGQMGRADEAVATLTAILDSNPADSDARMNRAIFLLGAGKLEAAKSDYLMLEKLNLPDRYRVYYGLAQIAERTNDTPGAIKYYKEYLQVAPTNNELRQVTVRLKELQGGKSL
jgi:predicted Zn-dependent protease